MVEVYEGRRGLVAYVGPSDKAFLKRADYWLSEVLMESYLYLKKLGVVPHRNKGVLVDAGPEVEDPAWRYTTCAVCNLSRLEESVSPEKAKMVMFTGQPRNGLRKWGDYLVTGHGEGVWTVRANGHPVVIRFDEGVAID